MRIPLVSAFLLAGAVAAQDPAAKVPPPQVQPIPGQPAPGQPANGQPAVPTKPGVMDPAPFAAAAKTWFPDLERKIEVHAGETEGKGVFPFKNPRPQVVEWKQLTGSCTCSHALVLIGERKYELRPKPAHLALVTGSPGAEQRQDVDSIPIEAGEEGTVEVYVDTHTMKGPKSVSLDIHTTDSEVPMVRLQLIAASDQEVTVMPPDVDLGMVMRGETRPFRIVVTSTRKDFELSVGEQLPMGIEATLERQSNGDKLAQSTWLINGTYRKDIEGDGGTNLTFKTNLKDTPTVLIKLRAKVRNLIEMEPGIFTLGIVRKGKGTTARIALTATDGRTLQATALRLEKLSLPEKYVTLRSSKDGAKLIVELEVAADAPAGLIRGDVVVELDHPQAKEQRVLFNGFVR